MVENLMILGSFAEGHGLLNKIGKSTGQAAKPLDLPSLRELKAIGMVWADVRKIIVADAIFHDADPGSRQSPNDWLTHPRAKGLIIDPRLLAERRPDRWRHLFSKLTVIKDFDRTREMTYCSSRGSLSKTISSSS